MYTGQAQVTGKNAEIMWNYAVNRDKLTIVSYSLKALVLVQYLFGPSLSGSANWDFRYFKLRASGTHLVYPG